MAPPTILNKLVRNDAMKVDPPEIYNWRVLLLACASCFGGTLFGMDIGIIGGVITLPSFKNAFGYEGEGAALANANLSADIVSVMQCGAFLGALLANPLADKWGRKPGLLGAATFAGLGGMMQAAASGNIGCLYAGRFVEGLALGGATMLTPTYISENAPRATRGMLVGLYQLFETMGAMLAFWINYGSQLHISGDAEWQIPLAMQCLPPTLLFLGMLLCNESPRWLARTDRWERSLKTLSHVRNLPGDHPYIVAEMLEMQRQLEEELASVNGGSGFWPIVKEIWTVPSNRKRAILSIVLMVCQQMTGTNAINYYAPTIFTNLGITGNSNSLFATGIYGIVKMVSCGLFLIFLADTLGRRWSLIWTGTAMAVAMLYLGFYVRFDPPVANEPVSAAGYVALVMVYLFAAFFQFGWGPVCWIYVSEIPTSRLRGLNVSLAAATQWLFNLVVARATPVMLVTVGNHGYGTYFIFGSFCACMVVIAWFFVPETKGISLERMDELFGGVDFGDIDDVGEAAQKTEKLGEEAVCVEEAGEVG
ncbi:MFS quinate transporter [Lecanosticta acicola]|uniref:MFS quinate transporter n=1 Tax=Lecanosticta acicola TaxID=111012 RepID=A0AAI9EFR8_9PEZI|nr:MFS quinate transporter [Lecanosticta acicola]